MIAADRRKARANAKSRSRQAFYRSKQKNLGLTNLQIRISIYAHSKAKALSLKTGMKLADIYINAIRSVNVDMLPAKHDQPNDDTLLGFRQISYWIDTETADLFAQKIAPHYRSRRTAISSIVFNYTSTELDDECHD